MVIYISLIVLAYLLGSVSSAVVVCKLTQLEDPRARGSNNPGATNVLRLHGGKAAISVLVGDVLKGVIAVLIGHILNAPSIILAGLGLAAFIGHLFPIFFNFQGGKGVATLGGILFGTCWMLGLAFVGTWLVIAFIFRYSSLASLIAAATAPIYTALLMFSQGDGNSWIIMSNTLMAILLFWRHSANIKSLLDGKEDKLGAN